MTPRSSMSVAKCCHSSDAALRRGSSRYSNSTARSAGWMPLIRHAWLWLGGRIQSLFDNPFWQVRAGDAPP